jgi:hypothetical protein
MTLLLKLYSEDSCRLVDIVVEEVAQGVVEHFQEGKALHTAEGALFRGSLLLNSSSS